jgi:hypothetical protein
LASPRAWDVLVCEFPTHWRHVRGHDVDDQCHDDYPATMRVIDEETSDGDDGDVYVEVLDAYAQDVAALRIRPNRETSARLTVASRSSSGHGEATREGKSESCAWRRRVSPAPGRQGGAGGRTEELIRRNCMVKILVFL